MIAVVSPAEILNYCRSRLNLQGSGGGVDDIFLSAMLRRAAGTLCPCSRAVLRAALVDSLDHLDQQLDTLPVRIDRSIDDLLVAGDLLELSDVTTGDIDAKGTWVFSAPPFFIERKSGSIFLTGIVPDQDEWLPEDLVDRVVFSSNTRSIKPKFGEDLAGQLIREGFAKLTEAAWLKAPRTVLATEALSKARQRLAAEAPCAPVHGLEIIDSETKPTYYKGRWTSPRDQTGMFVARRPQEFGASLWCFAELRSGTLIRIVDLPFQGYRWRGCDAAWHLQMAIDCKRNAPQRFNLGPSDDGQCRIDFFSPIPIWAERRLMLLGRKCEGSKSLFAYEIPVDEAAQEEEFLRENLWLAQLDENSETRSV